MPHFTPVLLAMSLGMIAMSELIEGAAATTRKRPRTGHQEETGRLACKKAKPESNNVARRSSSSFECAPSQKADKLAGDLLSTGQFDCLQAGRAVELKFSVVVAMVLQMDSEKDSPRTKQRSLVKLETLKEVVKDFHHYHSECALQSIYFRICTPLPHGNLKASNVLLDGSSLVARLSGYCIHRFMTAGTNQILRWNTELPSLHTPESQSQLSRRTSGVILWRLSRAKVPEASSPETLELWTDWVKLLVSEGRGPECYDQALVGYDRDATAGDRRPAFSCIAERSCRYHLPVEAYRMVNTLDRCKETMTLLPGSDENIGFAGILRSFDSQEAEKPVYEVEPQRDLTWRLQSCVHQRLLEQAARRLAHSFSDTFALPDEDPATLEALTADVDPKTLSQPTKRREMIRAQPKFGTVGPFNFFSFDSSLAYSSLVMQECDPQPRVYIHNEDFCSCYYEVSDIFLEHQIPGVYAHRRGPLLMVLTVSRFHAGTERDFEEAIDDIWENCLELGYASNGVNACVSRSLAFSHKPQRLNLQPKSSFYRTSQFSNGSIIILLI
ncbi:hypothetical protein SELMODRAFT_409220 [Selaginella moellendorffii]|uniref:Protein kinase domain-containing protein n=1 Tax=Selaginella moellendorffii TaxID=88036 RepID=D8RAR8_SELML|nr:hypothetical protein SELMODRAFT_409220 [Selaginella moellendorffii]